MSLLQDYSSIHQVRDKLIENDIITIFAVAEDIVVNRNIVYRVSEEVQEIAIGYSYCVSTEIRDLDRTRGPEL